MSEHDSFLKMIGIDDDLPESPPERQEPEESFEAQDENTENDWEAAEDSNTWNDWSNTLDEEESDGLNQILEEPTSSANDSADETTENDTSIYSSTDIGELEQELYEEATEEDKLLGGLESADASRATDIFAQSYRSDDRQTRAANASDENDEPEFLEDSAAEDYEGETVDQDLLGSTQIKDSNEGQYHDVWASPEEDYSSYIDQNSEIDEITNVEEGTKPLGEDENASTDAGRRTVAFSYDEEAAPEAPRLQLLEGQADSKEYELSQLPLRMGRDPGNEIVLDDANSSRYHAEIREQEGKVLVVDLGSTNGVKVNGALISEHELSSHDLIQIGDVCLEYLEAGESPSEGAKNLAAHETQIGYTPETTKRKFDRKKILRIAAAVLMGLGILLYGLKFSGAFDSAKQMATQELINKAETELADLRSSLVQETGSKPSDLSEELIYQEYQKRVQSLEFLPEKYQALLLDVPAGIVKAFMVDEALSAILMENAFDQAELQRALTEEFKRDYAAENYTRALRIMNLLVYGSPSNEEFLRIQRELNEKVNSVPEQDGGQVSEEDREKFARYMTDFQTKIEGFIEKGHLRAAHSLANKVKEGILDLVRDEPAFAPLAESAVAEWRAKADQIQRKIRERDSQKRQVSQMISKGKEALAKIKKLLDRGKVYEASIESQNFLENYPDHPQVAEVEAIQQEIGKAVTLSFDSLKSQIENYIKTENYKLAWEALYRFEDLMPGYPPAQELKRQLTGITRMRAAQFYNQARVFEYEADDLIAAEQYYKKTLETTDPRGDLARKAERRYAEVRRKGIQ